MFVAAESCKQNFLEAFVGPYRTENQLKDMFKIIEFSLSILFKIGCLQYFEGSRHTFSKILSYVLGLKTILKQVIWPIPGVSEGHFGIARAIFLKIRQKSWNSDFLPFSQKNGLNGP